MVWVKLDCPRCKATSSIDAAKAGQYAICPACQARVLVPINAPATDAPPANPQSQIGGQPAAAGGTPNLRKTVQASSLQTWVSGEPLPVAAGAMGGPATGGSQTGGPAAGGPQAVRPNPAASARPSSAPAGAAMADNPAVPLSPPMAGVPLLPPRANATQPTPPPAAPPVYPVQPVQPVQPSRAGFTGGPPPIAAGGMIPAMPLGSAPAAPPMPVPLPMPLGMAPPAMGAVAPAGSRKVARFIAAEPTQSTIKLAADGQLPSLQLIEADKKVTETAKGSTMNPLLVLGAIAGSICMSVILLIADIGPSEKDQRLEEASQKLEKYYNGAGRHEPLAPYQIHLREAQQACRREDYKTARYHYRKVLDLLHAEGGDRFHGLSGTRTRDKELEESLTALLLCLDATSGMSMDEP